MDSKADIIRRDLAGLSVLDLGGSGYGDDNAYERELRDAWSRVRSRTVVDNSERADLRLDLNQMPLPTLDGSWDMTAAFDILEHLEHPVEVLRWVPTRRLIVILPNAISPISRMIEKRGRIDHLFSFTPYTARRLCERGGWTVTRQAFVLGKWSASATLLHLFGSACPGCVATGLVLYAHREEDPGS